MQGPKKLKFKKEQKVKVNKKDCSFNSYVLSNGIYGLKAMESGRVSLKELEAAQKLIQKRIKKVGKVILMVYPSRPVTSKPGEVRMGKGKGSVSGWVCPITKGMIIFELISFNLRYKKIKLILDEAGNRLSIRTTSISEKR